MCIIKKGEKAELYNKISLECQIMYNWELKMQYLLKREEVLKILKNTINHN